MSLKIHKSIWSWSNILKFSKTVSIYKTFTKKGGVHGGRPPSIHVIFDDYFYSVK